MFVKNKAEAGQDLTVAGQLGLRLRKGQVGIEVECESVQANVFPKTASVANYWGYHQDGSLRGADNAEYVLNEPLSFEEADKAVDALWAVFKEKKIKLSESVRTSVHVHLNVLDFYQNRLASLLALWFICEEVLSQFCGDHRAGNLFCIRAKDGPAIITSVKNWFESKGEYGLNGDGLHYSALNVSALYKFGSVEIRTMRGLTEPAPLKQWLRILRKLYDASANYPDPRSIIEQFSLLGPVEFFQNLFKEDAAAITFAVQNDLNVAGSLFEGMRYAQDIAYVRDWSKFNPVKTVSDPFGRRLKPFKARRAAAPQGVGGIGEYLVQATDNAAGTMNTAGQMWATTLNATLNANPFNEPQG